MIKIPYENETMREDILLTNQALTLIEEQNITEGNFLVFAETENEIPVIIHQPPTTEERISALEETTNFLLGL